MPRPLRVVIHGGMHKTGTTSLQRVLAAHRPLLDEHGIFYPGTVDDHGLMLAVQWKDWSPTPIVEAIAQAGRIGTHTLFLSGETVSVLTAEQMRRLADCFRGHEIVFVFCFRHWNDYLPSRWSQYSRRRDSQPFGDYIENISRADAAHIDWRYDLVLERSLALNEPRIVAISYPNAIACDGSALPTILRAGGFPENLVEKLTAAQDWLNPSPRWQDTEVTRLLNGLIADRLGLAQDALSRSIGGGSGCDEVFDLPLKWHVLRPAVRTKLYEVVDKAQIPTNFDVRALPSEHPAVLLETYRPYFINADTSAAILGNPAPTPLIHTNLRWQGVSGSCIGLGDMVAEDLALA